MTQEYRIFKAEPNEEKDRIFEAVKKLLHEVDAYNELKFQTVYAGHGKTEEKDAEGKKTYWEHDRWVITLRMKERQLSSDYRTGLGLRRLIKYGKTLLADSGRSNSPNYRPNMSANYRRSLIAEHSLPVYPHFSDVFYSLWSDSQAVKMSFCDWAMEYGYDSDSIRALSIYNQCCVIGHKMRELTRGIPWAKIDELFQDY